MIDEELVHSILLGGREWQEMVHSVDMDTSMELLMGCVHCEILAGYLDQLGETFEGVLLHDHSS